MTKYGTKKSAKKSGSGLIRQVFFVLVSVSIGYLMSVFYDHNQLMSWFHSHLFKAKSSIPSVHRFSVKPDNLPKPKFEFYTLLTQDSHTGHTVTVAAPQKTEKSVTIELNAPDTSAAAVKPSQHVMPVAVSTVHPVELPVPHLDVRALTPKPHVASLPALIKTKQLSRSIIENQESFLLQLGSFKQKSEALRMKAMLTLNGLHVAVIDVRQGNVMWYRVVLGPFATRALAQNAQSNVAHTQHIMGMIRKVGD